MFLDVNGKRMQSGHTGKMIFKINYILSHLSNFMTLLPGDIITTGTLGTDQEHPVGLHGGSAFFK